MKKPYCPMMKFLTSRALLIGLACGPAWIPMSRADTFVVVNADATGPGSLRQALLNANTNANRDTIIFSIAGAGVKTITPTAALPQQNYPVVIDGTTQPGYVSTPLIQISGASAGTVNGLLLLGGNSVVRGLAINRFGLNGIRIESYGSNVIERVFLGADPSGTVAVGNGNYGLAIANSPGNRIGGLTGSVANVISSNAFGGILINGAAATGNLVQGNFIGTDLTGRAVLGNSANGVYLANAPGNWIGGTNPASGNVISGNRQSGVYISGGVSTGNRVLRNFIGTGVDGTNALPNREDGVTVLSSAANQIGAPGAGNLVSGNLSGGITLSGVTAITNVVQANYVGTDVTGVRAIGNTRSGITLISVTGTLVGGAVPGAGNLVSGNGESGIRLADSLTAGNQVLGNRVGTDMFGTNAVPNAFHGISIAGPNNLVGGPASGAGNLASGNLQVGILLSGPGATGNAILGNRVGLTANGTARRANTICGIYLDGAATNFIGGSAPGAGNVVSANGQCGVLLVGLASTGNQIQGNLVGTDASGSTALGNGTDGVAMSNSPANRLGGANPGEGNVISGNAKSGLFITGLMASNNVIAGNFIGTDRLGRVAVANTSQGVFLSAPRTLIGGTQLGAGNVISGNNNVAVSIGDAVTTDTVLQGNWIGLQADGVSALGNSLHGVEVLNGASRTTIGGNAPSAANRIAYARTSPFTGVRIRDGCTNNAISGNAVFSNPGLGIDLGAAGVNANRVGADPGPATSANRYQNYPVLTSATNRFRTVIQGTLNSVSNQTFTLNFYANTAPDPSGYGEGQYWLGAAAVTTSAAGGASFTVVFTNTVAITGAVCATATDVSGNTSEFSANVPISTGIIADTDGDGLPDDYELAWGFNPANPTDAGLDADGDGVSNLKEYQAGTDPRNPADFLRILAYYPQGSNYYWVSFDSRPGKRYTLQRSTDLNPTLRLAAVGPSPTNGFGVRITGSAGQGMVLEASTNLTTWQAVVTNAFTTGSFQYYEPLTNSLPRRYYRASAPLWIDVVTNFVGIGGPVWLVDTNRNGLPIAFYRIKCNP